MGDVIREDGKEKEERVMEVGKEAKEELDKKRKRGGEKEENGTGSVKRGCVGSVSVEAFDIFSQGGGMESCGGDSWEDLLEKPENLSDYEPKTRVDVSVVIDVSVSPFSVVTEFCDVFFFCSDSAVLFFQ